MSATEQSILGGGLEHWFESGVNLFPNNDIVQDIGDISNRVRNIFTSGLTTKIDNGTGSYYGIDYETIEIRKTNSIYTDSGLIFYSPYSDIYSGVITEVGGEVFSVGINVDQIDTNYNNTRYGGIFRFDTRPGFPYFSVIRKDFFNNPFLDFSIDVDGKVGIGTGGGATSRLHIYDNDGWNQLLLESPYTPTSSFDTNGTIGNICWDEEYLYLKTASGWKSVLMNFF